MSVPIIDYASPVSRKKLRLPARSEIAIDESTGCLTIRETLAGRDSAIGALLFAAVVFVVMVFTLQGLSVKWWRNVEQMVLLGVLMTTETAVAAMVMHNTWRKTVLTVTPAELTLLFSAPFTPAQHHRFATEQVAGVRVVDHATMPDEATFAELEFQMWPRSPVRLFAGHPPGMLAQLASRIVAAQQASAPPKLTNAAQPTRFGNW